jgi:hypothetical protein
MTGLPEQSGFAILRRNAPPRILSRSLAYTGSRLPDEKETQAVLDQLERNYSTEIAS